MGGQRLRFGLSLNVTQSVDRLIEKSVEAERLGLDSLWLCDTPSHKYGAITASAIASRTRDIEIGLGFSPFLHSPREISSTLLTLIRAYGERFELCIVPGDKDELRRVCVSRRSPEGVPHHLLDTREKIEKDLREGRVRCKIWLGAQGPKVLEISSFFDSVHLNYASPRMIRWAVSRLGEIKKKGFEVGIIAPSYIFSKYDSKLYETLRTTSCIVAFGTSEEVLSRFSLYDGLKPALEKASCALVPPEVTAEFSIFMRSEELQNYLSEIAGLGIRYVVFASPQDSSIETVRDLAKSIRLIKDNSP